MSSEELTDKTCVSCETKGCRKSDNICPACVDNFNDEEERRGSELRIEGVMTELESRSDRFEALRNRIVDDLRRYLKLLRRRY